jgi:hypothetical protein
MSKLTCKVIERISPIGLARFHMEEIIQQAMNEGWTLRSHTAIPYNDQTELRVFYVFAKKEK